MGLRCDFLHSYSEHRHCSLRFLVILARFNLFWTLRSQVIVEVVKGLIIVFEEGFPMLFDTKPCHS